MENIADKFFQDQLVSRDIYGDIFDGHDASNEAVLIRKITRKRKDLKDDRRPPEESDNPVAVLKNWPCKNLAELKHVGENKIVYKAYPSNLGKQISEMRRPTNFEFMKWTFQGFPNSEARPPTPTAES